MKEWISFGFTTEEKEAYEKCLNRAKVAYWR